MYVVCVCRFHVCVYIYIYKYVGFIYIRESFIRGGSENGKKKKKQTKNMNNEPMLRAGSREALTTSTQKFMDLLLVTNTAI